MTVGARGRFSRRGPGDDRVRILSGPEEDEEPGVGAGTPRAETVRFALLPDAYQPLRPPAPGGKRPYGKRLRKYGKNVGKALQKGCRYLVVGLQGLAAAYSAPFGVAVQVASLVR
uniref:Chromosome 1 open reading frame 115 n=2 Tax=Anser TaxID=8842 RepID=A0A8B9CGB8_9AVES